ncbi:GspE/PulE family protein [Chitinimonas koreensis]|uniref:GspE/PulE family protein n=1 Tax=Chitinimonas koreensis TaxID=356302 RepID=UPI00048B34BB|nr:GspE/PulE family protein [Chitinimonas koreensis]QNM98637.1 type II/IV secretion system protein [Chitinimonas koreensis]
MADTVELIVLRSKEELQRFVDELDQLEPIPLGRLLREYGLVEPQALDAALGLQRLRPERRIGDILVGLGLVSPRTLEYALGLLVGSPRVVLDLIEPDPAAMQLLPVATMLEQRVLPLLSTQDKLVLACARLPAQEAMAKLQFIAQKTPLMMLADRSALDAALSRHVDPLAEELTSSSLQVAEQEELDPRLWREAELQAKQEPVVRLVDSFLLEAIHGQASDIHIRPRADGFDLLYRVDGSLRSIRRLETNLLRAVVSRIKIISRLNIAEHRRPQDGHARIVDSGNPIDLRVSVIPTQYGESVVIRILNKRRGLRSVGEVGFSEHDERVFRDIISRNSGMLLVTGPTGSGKTTTLYAALQEIIAKQVNVVTVEDPVEYELAGVRQLQLDEAIDFSFPQALRHILRHDPDVIMIGEMRDAETARIGFESALTGHLVVSTLHSNSAAQAVLRLQEMGTRPHLVKNALLGVIGQRLVRCNCPDCAEPEAVAPHILEAFGCEASPRFRRGRGCARCHYTGFRGRRMVYELLPFSEAVREAIGEQTSLRELRRIAMSEGMRPITAHGLALAQEGLVSLVEVYQSCS